MFNVELRKVRVNGTTFKPEIKDLRKAIDK